MTVSFLLTYHYLREDSLPQLIQVFVEPGFDLFLKKLPQNLYVATMTQYIESPALHVLFPPPVIKNCLAEVLGVNNKNHFHIAETEKYAHVTFFFNGLNNQPFPNEADFFVESAEDPISE